MIYTSCYIFRGFKVVDFKDSDKTEKKELQKNKQIVKSSISSDSSTTNKINSSVRKEITSSSSSRGSSIDSNISEISSVSTDNSNSRNRIIPSKNDVSSISNTVAHGGSPGNIAREVGVIRSSSFSPSTSDVQYESPGQSVRISFSTSSHIGPNQQEDNLRHIRNIQANKRGQLKFNIIDNKAKKDIPKKVKKPLLKESAQTSTPISVTTPTTPKLPRTSPSTTAATKTTTQQPLSTTRKPTTTTTETTTTTTAKSIVETSKTRKTNPTTTTAATKEPQTTEKSKEATTKEFKVSTTTVKPTTNATEEYTNSTISLPSAIFIAVPKRGRNPATANKDIPSHFRPRTRVPGTRSRFSNKVRKLIKKKQVDRTFKFPIDTEKEEEKKVIKDLDVQESK